jgi:hypothetical protein
MSNVFNACPHCGSRLVHWWNLNPVSTRSVKCPACHLAVAVTGSLVRATWVKAAVAGSFLGFLIPCTLGTIVVQTMILQMTLSVIPFVAGAGLAALLAGTFGWRAGAREARKISGELSLHP